MKREMDSTYILTGVPLQGKLPGITWFFKGPNIFFVIFGFYWEKLQYILSDEDFLAVKVDEVTSKWRQSDVNPAICVYENIFTDSWVDVISVNFNSKKVHENDIFVRQDILQFFSVESKDYKYLKSS